VLSSVIHHQSGLQLSGHTLHFVEVELSGKRPVWVVEDVSEDEWIWIALKVHVHQSLACDAVRNDHNYEYQHEQHQLFQLHTMNLIEFASY